MPIADGIPDEMLALCFTAMGCARSRAGRARLPGLSSNVSQVLDALGVWIKGSNVDDILTAQHSSSVDLFRPMRCRIEQRVFASVYIPVYIFPTSQLLTMLGAIIYSSATDMLRKCSASPEV